MIEKNLHNTSSEQPPIPVPPVEQSWSDMRKLLDKDMPASANSCRGGRGPANNRLMRMFAWIVGCLFIAVISCILWIRHHKPRGKAAIVEIAQRQNLPHLNPGKDSQRVPDSRPNKTIDNPSDSFADSNSVAASRFSPSADSNTARRKLLSSPAGIHVISGNRSNTVAVDRSSSRNHSVPREIVGKQKLTLHEPSKGSPVLSSGGRYLNERREKAVDWSRQLSLPGMADLHQAINSSARSFADSSIRKIVLIKPSGLSASDKKGSPNARKPPVNVPLSFSAGLGLNKYFPIGGRENSPYDANAGTNKLSDYFPSPFVNMYLGKKVHLHAELNVNSPQFVKPRIIDSTASDSSSNNGHSLLSLSKLYYNALAMSVHYRVAGPLTIGAGIRVASLRRAIAQNIHVPAATGGTGDSSSTVTAIRLSSDTVNQFLRRTDWRLTLDAAYTWRRLTVGVEYGQGLSNVLLKTADGQGTADRNISFSVFIQYALWEKNRSR